MDRCPRCGAVMTPGQECPLCSAAARIKATLPHVVITDVDIGIWNLAILLVRLAIASIPAALILAVIYGVFGVFIARLFVSMLRG